MKMLVVVLILLAVAAVVPAQSGGGGEEALPYGIIIAEQARASFSLIGAGARAAGMGGAFTAVADDATAASFNPAGLAQLLVPEASLVLSHPSVEDSYRQWVSFGDELPQRLDDAIVDHDHLAVNFLSATVPFRMLKRRWAVQLSRHRLVDFEYDGSVELLASRQGTPVALIEQGSHQRGDINITSGSLAVELTQRTLLGLTFNRWGGEWGFESINGRQSLVGDQLVESRLRFGQESSMRGWNVDLGLLLRYPRVNIGVRYRSAFEADFRLSGAGEYQRTAQPGEPPEPLTGLETSLHWPSTLNLGLALKLSDRWLVAADWGRTDWSRLTFDVPADETGTAWTTANFFDLFPKEYTNTRVSEDLRIGTEFLFFAGESVIPIRAGWFKEPQPSRDVYTGEGLGGEGYSFGVGIKRGAIAADIAVRYKSDEALVSRFFLPRDLEASELALGPNSLGYLQSKELSVFASVIIQFTKGSGLSNALHQIFVGPVTEDR